jgi:hypothetical protein
MNAEQSVNMTARLWSVRLRRRMARSTRRVYQLYGLTAQEIKIVEGATK